MQSFFSALETIENYCEKSQRIFKDFSEKLEYAGSLMPPVFTKGTKYSRDGLKVVK